MNKNNGQELAEIEHLKQSIADILTTPIGTRVMLRDYGSHVFDLVDKPIGPGFALELYSAVADALMKWEPRLKLDRVQVVEVKNSQITLKLEGTYLPNKTSLHYDLII